ncbi:MAG: hypothetical protein GTO41_21780 [Burkholderiales bacterium]|nr:hypothetical protein [Burkholderiales bacterium]
MTSEFHAGFLQNRIVRFLVTNTLEDARALLRRFQEVESFNTYVHERMAGVLAAVLGMFLISMGCVMGIVTLLPDMHWTFVLPMLLALPIVLAGSLFVQVYVFFSWIEGRSMELALGSRRMTKRGAITLWVQQKFKLDLGPSPSVPWLLTTIFLIAPLLLLASSWLPAAVAFMTLGILLPLTYAFLDR